MGEHRNRVSQVQVNEYIISNPTKIKEEAFVFFQNLYREEGEVEPCKESKFLDHITHLVTLEINTQLLKATYDEEIREPVWFFDLDKAPKIDGFIVSFYKKNRR